MQIRLAYSSVIMTGVYVSSLYNNVMRLRQDIWFFALISVCVLILISLPYLAAIQLAGSDYVFAGFLINPLDGNSYLAKMYQGWEGSWQFHLPYTPEEGSGTYLNLFYLFLGNLAQLIDLTPLLVFHLARLVCAGFFLWALWHFFNAVLTSSFTLRLAFGLSALGSGLGWIAGLLGVLTSDLWVAEAFPFLAMYVNPHFPLGLALVLILLTPQAEPPEKLVFSQQIRWAFLASALTIVMPFGLVVVMAVMICLALWESLGVYTRAPQLPEEINFGGLTSVVNLTLWRKLFWVMIGGVPILIYDLWVTYRDPLLSGWNAQNLTPSPPWWDLLVSFGVLLIFGIPGAYSILKNKIWRAHILLAWPVIGLVLLCLPVGLQRRFMLGMLIPLAGLASMGIEYLAGTARRRKILLTGLTLVVLLPTNLIVVMSGLYGATTHDSQLYLSKDEQKAMTWLVENSPQDVLVLSSPDMGLFMPAYTGRRVIYGHPFETVSASEREAQVNRLLAGAQRPADVSTCELIDMVFWGPREQALVHKKPALAGDIEFSSGEVTLYRADSSGCEYSDGT